MDVSRSSINIPSSIEKISVNSKHSHLQSSTGQPHIVINTNLTCVDMEHKVSNAPELWEFEKPTNFLNSIYEGGKAFPLRWKKLFGIPEVTVTPFPFPPSFNMAPTIEICPPNVTSLPIENATVGSISPETNVPNMGTSTPPTDYTQSTNRDKPLFYRRKIFLYERKLVLLFSIL